MNKTELLNTLRAARAEWDALLARVPEERMAESGVVGEWTLKDLVAHITWHEREIATVLRERSMESGSPHWGLGNEGRNAAVYAENRDRPLAEVRAEAGAVFRQLVAAIEGCAEEDLHDPSRIAGMPPDWSLPALIADNSYEHYQAHTPDVRAWLD